MVPGRAYGQGFREGSNGRTKLLYFAAAVPMVGFVHGAADLNPGNRAGFEGYSQARLTRRAQPIDRAAHAECAAKPSRWPLGLRWLPER
jgi:hypothetical protein